MLASVIASMDKEKRFEVDIYEATANLTEIGAGINLWRRTYDMLVKIGLGQDMLKLCERTNESDSRRRSLAFQFRKGDQKNGHFIFDLYAEGGLVRARRTDLQKILLKRALTSCRLHLSRKLVSYTEHPDSSSGSVHLTFEDGSEATCELLVGADGIKSTVRRLFLSSLQPGTTGYQESIEPVWTGTYIYRGVIPREELEKKLPGHRVTKMPLTYLGKRRHVVTYSMAEGQFVNVVATVHDESREETQHEGPMVIDVPQEELLSVYRGWDPEVQALIECIPKPKKWAIHHLLPLKKYAERRVLLLGDAAHAMGPHQGAGAGQAMEDAYVLAHILLHPDIVQPAAQIPLITYVYDALMVLTDDDMELPYIREGNDKVPHEVLERYVKKLLGYWKWHWETSVEGDCRNASILLREILGDRSSDVKL
ncbi:hypothetical protein AX15_000951 [Amanita polypyramis BW_CC]|nr:hypothetical protein AX15_000951 [Amanita polypyramis BW_CC]